MEKIVDLKKISDEAVEDIDMAFADHGVALVRKALLDRFDKLESAIAEFEFRYGHIHQGKW